MTLSKYSLWSALMDAHVEIRQNGKTITSGTVAAAAADSSVLWLAADGVDSRRMFEAALGYEVWVKAQLLDGPSHFQYRMTTDNLYGAQYAPDSSS